MDPATVAELEAAFDAIEYDHLDTSAHARHLTYRITVGGRTDTGRVTVYGRIGDDQAAAYLAQHHTAGPFPAAARLTLTDV